MPAKKSASKKTSPAKRPVKKTTGKKGAKKTASAKKAVGKTTANKASSPTKKQAAKTGTKGKSRPKASDYVKRPSHTPAIFKTANRRAPHILFTIEDVREVLEKRLREEKEEQKKAAEKVSAAKKAVTREVAEAPNQPVKSKHQAASIDDILGLSSSPSQQGGPRGGNVPRKFQKYYKLLLELRHQVREELDMHSNDTLKRSQKEDAGDLSISVDAGTDNFDRDFALSLLSSEQDALKEIEAAIDRIHKGTYGLCEVTGEPIKAERLEAVPFTRFSVEGQKQYEASARKRVSRTGAFLNESSGEKISFGDDDGDN